MSDRLVSQLADRLELDESDVTPILNALLKQVRQRAQKGSGARVPTLGTFTTDADGTLQFEPEDDLVDTVNADFAGLESEPAPTPKRAPDTSTALAEAPSAPDDPPSSASRSDSEETADTPDTTDAPDKSATEELPAASTSSSASFADEPEDPEATQELNAPPASSSDPEPADSEPADSEPADAPDTGSLWPAEANAPTTPDVTDGAEDATDEHDEDEDDDFWSRDREWDLSSVAFGDESDDESDDADDAEPALASTSLGDEADTFSGSRAAASDSASDSASVPTADTAADRPASASPESPERSGMRTGLGIAVVLAALIGGWIVLGAVGVVPGPGAAVDGIRSSFSGGSETVETAPEPTADASDTPDSTPSDPSPSDASRPSDASPGASGQDAASSDTGTDEAQSTSPETRSAAAGIVPAEGGWTLVVASRTTEQEAESIRAQYANALQSANVPIDVLPSTGSDGTTRYRVVVGQFSSQEAVRNLQDEYSTVVPSDAWPLAL